MKQKTRRNSEFPRTGKNSQIVGFWLIFILLFLVNTSFIFSQSNDSEQLFRRRIVWSGGEHSFRFAVEIQKVEYGTFQNHLREYTVSRYLVVSLPEGDYQYRIIPYDILDRPAEGTKWMSFAVHPALLAENENLVDIIAPVSNARESIGLPQIEMIRVTAGSFERSSTDNTDGGNLKYRVTLSRDFWMGKYPVTQEQYYAVMGYNPSWFKTANGEAPAEGESDSRQPVERVTWFDTIEFCNKLSILEGLTPVFTITNRNPASGYPITGATITVNWSANGYRLPTENEWEYACRAGTNTVSNTGVEINDDSGWFRENSNNHTREVGLKFPNALGLYDMYGNVSEWCLDYWRVNEIGIEQTDPVGAISGDYRTRCGGNWNSNRNTSNSFFQAAGNPSFRNYFTGFRVIRY